MEVRFYQFTKRYNSTARPSSQPVVYNVNLKQMSGVVNPTITLSGIDRPEYNYCQMMGRYYFCNDWTWNGAKLWECQLTEDYLATWRNEIAATEAMVLYSDSAGNDAMVDSRFGVSRIYERGQYLTDTEIFNTISGNFVIGVINPDASQANGFLTTYAVSWVGLQQLAAYINSEDVLTRLKQVFSNPYEALVFCNWLPLLDSAFSGDREYIKIAGETTEVLGIKYTNKTYSNTYSCTIPWGLTLPIDSSRCAPYTTLSMYLPFVGEVPLPSDILWDVTAVDVEMSIDVTTGDIVYRIKYPDSNQVLSCYSGSSGASIPIARQQQDFKGMLGAGAALIGGTIAATALTGGAAAAAGIGAIASAGATGVSSFARHTQVNGGISSRASSAFDSRISVSRITYPPNWGDKKSALGLPTVEVMRLGDLSGYVQTYGASVSAAAYGQEIQAVNNMLDSGVYIE